jgi:hypothetical protein
VFDIAANSEIQHRAYPVHTTGEIAACRHDRLCSPERGKWNRTPRVAIVRVFTWYAQTSVHKLISIVFSIYPRQKEKSHDVHSEIFVLL